MKIKAFKFNRSVDEVIIKLAWPSIMEQILEMMVGMVSTMFMGRVGTDAVAGVGMVNMLMGLLQSVFAGLSMGTTVIIARVTGEGNVQEAKRALIQSIYMGLFIGITFALCGSIFSHQILSVFFHHVEPEVFKDGMQYFSIVLLSMPFFVLDIIVSGAMRGAGDTTTPMMITAGVNVLNIVLNTMFVFGVHSMNIPAMGVKGSAIAVTLSRITAISVKLFVLYFKKNLKLHLSITDDYRIHFSLIKRIVNIGVPGFIEQAVMQGGFLMVQIIIVSMGTVAMAAYQVGINVNSLAFFPIFGFAVANTTLVGQSLGERNYKKAESFAYESMKITMVMGFVIGLVMLVSAPYLARLYTTDQRVIHEAVGLIRVFGVLEPLMAILNVCSSTLRAAGDIKYVMITSLVGLWSFRILLSYGLSNKLHLAMTAVMIGIFFDFSSRSFMYLSRMHKGKWKYIRV